MTRLLMAMTTARAADVCDSDTRTLIDTSYQTTWAADHLDDPDRLDEASLRRLLPGHEVVITSWGTPRLPDELLGADAGPTVVAHAAGTVRNLVPPECLDRVTVFSAASRIAWSVGEYCLSALLILRRRLPEYDARMREGGWKPTDFRGQELSGLRVGIVGASATARALIELLRPFDTEIVVYDPYLDAATAASLGVRTAELEEVVESPVLSIHVPATPATAGMITADLIRRIPDHGIVINSSRATAVDNQVLIAEAASGRLRVALDVYPSEPPEPDPALLDNRNLLLTPHIAGDALEGHRALTRYVLDDVAAFLADGRRGPSWVDPATLSIAA